MSIQAIETEYKGYKFRSRLEARWAVFFDKLGIRWEYEPDGFWLINGEGYLPDFYLPELDSCVEIKPIGAINIEHKDDGEILFGDGRESGEKYGFAMATIVPEHPYIVFHGDPFDALVPMKEIGGNGKSHMFYKGILVENGEALLCLNSVCAISSNMILIYTGDRMPDALPENEHICACWVDRGCARTASEICDQDNILEYIATTMKEALNARKVRFEHGENP